MMFINARVALVSPDVRHLAVPPKIGNRNRLTMRTYGSKLAAPLRWSTISLALGLLTSLGATARAGGGPENVFLLVNSHSEASKTIANHYIQLRHIPYKGEAQAMNALVAGEVDMMAYVTAPVVPFVQNGRLRALAATSSERWALLPQVPSYAETGLPALGIGIPNN